MNIKEKKDKVTDMSLNAVNVLQGNGMTHENVHLFLTGMINMAQVMNSIALIAESEAEYNEFMTLSMKNIRDVNEEFIAKIKNDMSKLEKARGSISDKQSVH